MSEQKIGAPPPLRDWRIDRIGLIDELKKHHADPMRNAVKADYEAGTRLAGDRFKGLVYSFDPRTVRAAAWLRLFEDGEITRKQFTEGLSVSTDVAERVLDEQTFKRISEKSPTVKVLRVERIDGPEIGAVQAIEALAQQLKLDAAA